MVKIPHYLVLVADPTHPEDVDHAAEHQVRIMHGDQMRAELEGPRNGIPSIDQAPMHGIALWIWAALMRTHVIDEPYQAFVPRLLGFEQMTDDVGGEPVGPTPPEAATTSHSSSPTSSETSAAGLTQTETPVS